MSETAGGDEGVVLVRGIPALPVRHAVRAATYYHERFGFTISHADAGFAVLRRGDAEVHLWQSDDESWRSRTGAGSPVCSGAESFLAGTASCRIESTGIDALYAELRSAEVLHPASRAGTSRTDFGTHEFATVDHDGNLLTFFCWVGR